MLPRHASGFRRLLMLADAGLVTELWPMSGRRSAELDTWAELDLFSVHRSLWLDIRMLARTLPPAIEGRWIAVIRVIRLSH